MYQWLRQMPPTTVVSDWRHSGGPPGVGSITRLPGVFLLVNFVTWAAKQRGDPPRQYHFPVWQNNALLRSVGWPEYTLWHCFVYEPGDKVTGPWTNSERPTAPIATATLPEWLHKFWTKLTDYCDRNDQPCTAAMALAILDGII